MNFTPCGKNGTVEGYCIIKTIEQKLTQKGAAYLDMTISDASGEINAKFWDLNDFHIKLNPFDFVKVRGTLNVYNGQDQFKIDRIRPVTEADDVRLDDFVESAGFSGEVMLNAIKRVVDKFSDEELKKLVSTVIEQNYEKLLYWPAALKLHHAIRGGLLLHTLSILRIAHGITKVYTYIDKDLLYTGIILHDIAKIYEIESSKTGVSTDYTVKGNLLGHLVMGAININEISKQIGISEETATLVEHMLISHHGAPEFGAAQYPMFIEAEILAELDLLDARLYEMSRVLKDVKPCEFSARQWALDNRKLYNHGRSSEYNINVIDE